MNTGFKNCFLKIIKKFWLLLFFVPILIAFEEYLRIFSYPHKYKSYAVFREIKNDSFKLNKNIKNHPFFKNEVEDVSYYYNILKNDKKFMKNFFKKYNIKEKYIIAINSNNLVFSAPFLNEMLKQGYYFNTHRIILKLKKRSEYYFLSKLFKRISKSLSIKKNPKTGLIYMSYINYDRKFAYELLSNFITYSSDYLLKEKIEEIKKNLKKYNEFYKNNYDTKIRNDIKNILSQLIKEKIFLENSKLYKLKYLVKPYIPLKEQNMDSDFDKYLRIILFYIGSLLFLIIIVFFGTKDTECNINKNKK